MKTYVFVSRTFRLAVELPIIAIVVTYVVLLATGAIRTRGEGVPTFGIVFLSAILTWGICYSLLIPDRADVADGGSVTLHSVLQHRTLGADGIASALLSGVSRWSPTRMLTVMLMLRGRRAPLQFPSRARPLHGFLCAVLTHNPAMGLRVIGSGGRAREGNEEILERLRGMAGTKDSPEAQS